MQFSAIVNRFIVKTYLYSAFTNDLKRKEIFQKMFIVADLVSLTLCHLSADNLCKQFGPISGLTFCRGLIWVQVV